MADHGRADIRSVLEACEKEFGFPTGTLVNIYNTEARVVFMGKRRNVLKELREMVYQVTDLVGGTPNDNSKA